MTWLRRDPRYQLIGMHDTSYDRYGAVAIRMDCVPMMGWGSIRSGFELFEGLVVWCVLAEPPWEACFDDFVVRSFREEAWAMRRRRRGQISTYNKTCFNFRLAARFSQCLHSREVSPKKPQGQGFIAAASMKRAGKVSEVLAREMVTWPSSNGCRCHYHFPDSGMGSYAVR